MSTNDTEVIGDNGIHLLGELRTLLEKQVDKARQGNITDVELLSKQVGALIDKILQKGIFLDPADPMYDKERREQLQKLYEDLCLAVAAQRAVVCEELSRVRKGKKTLQAYHGHV